LYQDEQNDSSKIDIYSDKFIEWEQSSYDQTLGSLLFRQFPRLFEWSIDLDAKSGGQVI